MNPQPALFISHGSPLILLDQSPGRHFLENLGQLSQKPRAILLITAHWTTENPSISIDPAPSMIYDFGGFPPELYAQEYLALGEPDVALLAASKLREQGFSVDAISQRGFDHGTWVPLKLAYPDADIPVVQMSVQPHKDARWHYRIGQALSSLRDDNIMIIASGAMTHNLRAYFKGQYTAVPYWVTDFTNWIDQAISEQRTQDVLAFETKAPFARENHPTPEHFLPFFVALGAGQKGERIHRSVDGFVLAMDAYAF